MAHPHDRLHLVGRGRQQHRQGQHPEHGEPVALVSAELLRLGDQIRRADDGAKLIEDPGFHGGTLLSPRAAGAHLAWLERPPRPDLVLVLPSSEPPTRTDRRLGAWKWLTLGTAPPGSSRRRCGA